MTMNERYANGERTRAPSELNECEHRNTVAEAGEHGALVLCVDCETALAAIEVV